MIAGYGSPHVYGQEFVMNKVLSCVILITSFFQAYIFFNAELRNCDNE